MVLNWILVLLKRKVDGRLVKHEWALRSQWQPCELLKHSSVSMLISWSCNCIVVTWDNVLICRNHTVKYISYGSLDKCHLSEIQLLNCERWDMPTHPQEQMWWLIEIMHVENIQQYLAYDRHSINCVPFRYKTTFKKIMTYLARI